MTPAPKEAVTGNGIGGKMKIVKNKNKNGRIVIVMSKYMENGMQADEPEEPLSEFKPFFGNIIITDVTANCLTVTFKEYVTV
ncbi:hypothetical protein E2I00_003433 [Balaenoptera physalus]|uniref:Uncharacterized protein n=1 Tax=Balaenoptera physalus TaxID=9770 RepID=A0A643C4X3_BALPH|nr:hypothetical protein E2I00_003433 [Balaenoptera physalus]